MKIEVTAEHEQYLVLQVHQGLLRHQLLLFFV